MAVGLNEQDEHVAQNTEKAADRLLKGTALTVAAAWIVKQTAFSLDALSGLGSFAISVAVVFGLIVAFFLTLSASRMFIYFALAMDPSGILGRIPNWLRNTLFMVFAILLELGIIYHFVSSINFGF